MHRNRSGRSDIQLRIVIDGYEFICLRLLSGLDFLVMVMVDIAPFWPLCEIVIGRYAFKKQTKHL